MKKKPKEEPLQPLILSFARTMQARCEFNIRNNVWSRNIMDDRVMLASYLNESVQYFFEEMINQTAAADDDPKTSLRLNTLNGAAADIALCSLFLVALLVSERTRPRNN